MDEMLKELEKLKDMSNVFTMWDVAIALTLSFFLTLIVAKVYKETHKGVSYSQSYVHTMVIMAVVVSVIMLIIGSNIARAFSLVGALSIIRFRNAVKETRDVGFVFLSMAIGMACGTKFYMLATFFTSMACGFILLMDKLNLFAKEIRERVIMVQVPDGLDYEVAFDQVFSKYFNDVGLISMETIGLNDGFELIYGVSVKNNFNSGKFLSEMQKLNNGRKVSLIEGQQQVDL